ncbi:MAG: formylglycine-generating enzyme family protein [Chitinophagales bacterium]|nr:formylglycine-generating enzyme family protein [Chitinophagales bacterium]
MKKIILILSIFLPFIAFTQMKWIDGGSYKPMYGADSGKLVKVNGFYIDETLVTNKEYLSFVTKYPQWKKGNTKKIFADESYLNNWTSDTKFPNTLLNTPVTFISWFAAKAYCECQGKRLPTNDEWEFVAMANAKLKDARKDSLNNAKILEQMQKRNTQFINVKQSAPNLYGVYDLHNLVWEWTYDFNAVMIGGENRNNNNKNLFCAAGSLNANNLMDYVGFMRFAFRASVKANYNVGNLGFRCVKSK